MLTYLTAQVSDGKVSYLDDFYGWDTSGTPQFAAASNQLIDRIGRTSNRQIAPKRKPARTMVRTGLLRSWLPLRGRAQAPAAAEEAEEAEPGKSPLPGSPSRPGTSASPEAAAEAAEVAAEAAEAEAEAPRNYRSRSRAGCATGSARSETVIGVALNVSEKFRRETLKRRYFSPRSMFGVTA